MRRLPTLVPGLLAVAMVCAGVPAPARGDDDDKRLARKLVTASEKYAEFREVRDKHGQRAEIAWSILEGEQARVNLEAEIRTRNADIAGFPQNHRWWSTEQNAYFQEKLELDKRLTALDRQLGELRLTEKQLYEAALQQAQAQGKAVKPFSREAILNDLQRLDRESGKDVTALKAAIETAAREQHKTPGQVLGKARDDVSNLSSSPPPGVVDQFVLDFVKHAGGKAWQNGARKQPSSSKGRKGSSRAKRNMARSDESGF